MIKWRQTIAQTTAAKSSCANYLPSLSLTPLKSKPDLFIYFARDLMVNIYNSSVGFNMYVTVAITAHWFSMSNSFVNPIIYCFMSENFRVKNQIYTSVSQSSVVRSIERATVYSLFSSSFSITHSFVTC